MPKINPFVGLFLGLTVLIVTMFVWLDGRSMARLDDIEASLDRVEAGQTALRADLAQVNECLARLEAGQARLRIDVGRVEAGEREARIEGAVAGALGRLFPETDRLARTAVPETAE